MAYVSKVWVDRQTEYPTRRKLEFDDGTDDKIVTVSRAEGTIYEAGDIFDANTMNTLESRIAAGIAEKQDILIPGNGIRIDQDNVISATGGGGGIEFTKIESGSLVSVNDAADLPVVDLAVEIKAIQSGTGDPSPSNVRPISGWSSVGVTRAGKNLFDGSMVATTHTSNWGITWANDILTIEHKTTYTTGLPACPLSLPVGNYVFSYVGDSGNVSLRKNGAFDKTLNNGTTFSIESGNTYEIAFSAPNNTTKSYSSIMVEVGSASSTYAPHENPTTVTIALGQTVYGGELDVTSGVLKITHAKITLDGTQEINTVNWRPNTNTVGWIYKYTDFQNAYVPYSSVANIISDKLIAKSYNTLYGQDTTGIATYNDSSLGLVVKMDDTSLTTKTAINAYLAQNPIDVVFPLATPVTVQLSGTEVSTLLGINNIYADSGDILNLEYYTQSASDVRDFIIKDEEVTDDASWSSEKIQDELDAKQDSLTAGDGIVFDGNEISAVLYKELTATLNVFSTSVVFEDAAITTNSVIDIYTSKYGFNPETVTAETGRLTITFRQPDEQITVKVRIS